MRTVLLAIAFGAFSLVVTSSAAAAGTQPKTRSSKALQSASAESPKDKADAPKSPPNFDALLGMFDKMFPPQPDPDPARLSLARTSVQTMWPDGAYGKMMSGFMGGIFDRVMQMKNSDLAALANNPKKIDASTPRDDRTLHDKAIAKDPHFDERMAAWRSIANDEVAKISTIIDPRMREGLARAMARRFNAQQLTDINAFFATSSGRALASQYMQLWVDPDTLRSVMGSFPEMMKLMPDMMQRFKAVDEKYPKPATQPASGTKK